MGGESILTDLIGESEDWDDVNFPSASSADDIFSILEALEESGTGNLSHVDPETSRTISESFEFQTSCKSYMLCGFQENSETEAELAAPRTCPETKRQKFNFGSEIIQAEEGPQRMTHITVERNRRRQMNDHLSVLRSLMPCFYVKRGDQASIIGGVIDYINELQQVLQSLEAKKQRKSYNEVLSPRPSSLSPRLTSPRTPQPKPVLHINQQPFYINSQSLPSPVDPSPCNSSNSSVNDSVNELVACSKSALAEVEVRFSGPNLLLNTVSRRVPGQVMKIISALEELPLEILKASISTVDERVMNSFVIKIGIECQLSAEELAHQIQQTFC